MNLQKTAADASVAVSFAVAAKIRKLAGVKRNTRDWTESGGMTLVHIALGRGRGPQDGQRIGRCVQRAITEALRAPLEDRYQIVTEQRAGAPGTTETDWAAIVLIYVTARYSGGKKRALFGRIAANLKTETHIHPKDVVVGLIQTPSENWSFGYGEARYIHMMPYQLP